MKKKTLIIIICLILLVISSITIGIIYKDKIFEPSGKVNQCNSSQQDWTGYANLYDAIDKATDDCLNK